MKAKLAIILGAVLIALGVILCLQPYQKQLSPKETMELYVSLYDKKNEHQMQLLMEGSMKETPAPVPLEYCEYVEIISCFEDPREEERQKAYDRVKEQWYPEAEEVTLLHVGLNINFTYETPIKISMGAYGAYTMAHYGRFYLAKAAESDPWMIVGYDY